MIGDFIAKIRKDKNISKSNISRDTQIDLGHLTHIEKGERNPSYKALLEICKSLDVPFQPLIYTYDKHISKEQLDNNMLDHISYNTVPAINNIDMLINCPSSMGKASIAIRVPDESMEPELIKGSYAYIEFNAPIDDNEIGLFYYDGKTLLRKLTIKNDFYYLKSSKKDIKDIKLRYSDEFYIIGKVLGSNTY